MPKAQREADLVREDFGKIALIPQGAVPPSVVDRHSTSDDLKELSTIDNLGAPRRAVATHREDAAAVARIGNLAERIVEDNPRGDGAAVVQANRRGGSGVLKNQVRTR